MALIPLVYFSLATFAMAAYTDAELKGSARIESAMADFVIVFCANAIATLYMFYCMFN